MEPQKITYTTELDTIYSQALLAVKTADEFNDFIDHWNYWLDGNCKSLKAKDWDDLKPKIKDCRDNTIIPNDEHNIAMALVLPAKILRVSTIAIQFGVPWGCAYIRAKEEMVINF